MSLFSSRYQGRVENLAPAVREFKMMIDPFFVLMFFVLVVAGLGGIKVSIGDINIGNKKSEKKDK